MHAYVGCRTTKERGARGRGLEVFQVHEQGTWSHVQTVPDLVNPSFLAFGKARDVLYTVHGDCSEVSAFRIDPKDGRLSALNRQSTGGRNPVHLATDATGRFVYVSNRGHDSIASFAVDPQDHTLRQVGCVPSGGSKPRFITLDPGGTVLFVANETSDTIVPFHVGWETGALSPSGSVIQAGISVCLMFLAGWPEEGDEG